MLRFTKHPKWLLNLVYMRLRIFGRLNNPILQKTSNNRIPAILVPRSFSLPYPTPPEGRPPPPRGGVGKGLWERRWVSTCQFHIFFCIGFCCCKQQMNWFYFVVFYWTSSCLFTLVRSVIEVITKCDSTSVIEAWRIQSVGQSVIAERTAKRGHIRAVYTRENKPRITQFADYVSRERAFCTSRVRINGSVRGLHKPRIV